MASMQRFGEKLRVLRNRQGLTLRQLSDVLEVSHSYIAKMERGEKIPNVEMVLKVSRIFNVSTDVLIKDELELED
jgi:transcriptional regulator with XRE-family HTH domain